MAAAADILLHKWRMETGVNTTGLRFCVNKHIQDGLASLSPGGGVAKRPEEKLFLAFLLLGL